MICYYTLDDICQQYKANRSTAASWVSQGRLHVIRKSNRYNIFDGHQVPGALAKLALLKATERTTRIAERPTRIVIAIPPQHWKAVAHKANQAGLSIPAFLTSLALKEACRVA